jgi:hypothetical protein
MAGTNVVRKALPSAGADGVELSDVGNRYGMKLTQPLYGNKQALAELGCYFVGTTVPMTEQATTTSITTFAETAGAVGDFLYIRNTETSTVNASKRIYPDYLRLQNHHVAPTSATDLYISGCIDYSATRYTSGGAAITPVNVNSDSSLASVASVYFGGLTTAIPASRRLLFSIQVLPRLGIVKDEIILIFGGIEGGYAPVNSAAIMNLNYFVPPCVIGPNANLVLKLWGTALAGAPEYLMDMGWWEM